MYTTFTRASSSQSCPLAPISSLVQIPFQISNLFASHAQARCIPLQTLHSIPLCFCDLHARFAGFLFLFSRSLAHQFPILSNHDRQQKPIIGIINLIILTMTNNSLQLAISELQKSHHVGSVSWSILASELLNLLKQYSSGLSFPVVVDQLSHLSPTLPISHRVHSTTLVATHQNPTLWLLSLPGDRIHAHVPHPSLRTLQLPTGVPVNISLHPHLFQNPSCHSSAYSDALAAVKHALRGVTNADAAKKPTANRLSPSSLSFPSTPVWFHLDSFPTHCLDLRMPIESYSLQRVWQEASLYPHAVYAQVLHVEPETAVVHLHDQCSLPADNRVVHCYFSPKHAPLLADLRPSHSLLIMAPGVHPTPDSFTLSVPENSLCLFFEQPQLSPRTDLSLKRRRIDTQPDVSYLASCTAPVDASSLASLPSLPVDCNLKLTVHARLSEPPKMRAGMTLCSHVEFSSGATRIRVVRSECHAEYCVGDEVLFIGVRRVEYFWTANKVENISTLTAILLAPFCIRFVNGQEIKTRIMSKCLTTTAHVCVNILSVQVIKGAQDIRLTVSDCCTNNLTNGEPWQISVSNRCLDVLFGVKDANELWDGDEDYATEIVTNNVNSLKQGHWRMTLTCDGSNSLFPKLCACVNVSQL